MIVGLIPARSGSKGVPRKNLKPLAGYPLIAYSIVASKLCSRIDRTIVSTDSEEYAEIARYYGAEVPFLRPPEISTDTSTDIEFVLHTLAHIEGIDLIVHLRPTTPLRNPAIIDKTIRCLLRKGRATSLRTVHLASRPPYKSFLIKEGYLEGIFPDDPRPEYYNLPRQSFPDVYDPNGYVDILKTRTVLNAKSLLGSKMLPFVMEGITEFDTLEEFEYIEWKLKKYGSVLLDYLKEEK